MLTRRQLLQRGAVGGAGLMLPTALLQSSALGAAPGIAPYQANLLNYIPPIVPVADGGTVDLAIRQVQRIVAPKAKPTTVWSYELASGDPRVSGQAGSWIGASVRTTNVLCRSVWLAEITCWSAGSRSASRRGPVSR